MAGLAGGQPWDGERREGFDATSVSVRRMTLAWVYWARRPVTRAARVEQVVSVAGRGEPLSSMWRRRA